MGNHKKDKETGLPLVGSKELPIGLDLIGEYKELIEARDGLLEPARDAALQALGLLSQALDIVRPALQAQKATLDFQKKVLDLHGVNASQVEAIDLEAGVIRLK